MCHPALYIAAAGMQMMQAKRAAQSAGAYAQAAHDANMQQIKDNRAEVILEAKQKGNMIAQTFMEKQATNRALLSSNGISSSMSVNAAFQYSKSNFKTELNAVAIEESRKQSGLAAKAQDSRLQLASTKSAAKAARNSAYLKAATTAAIGIQGLKAPTGGSELAGNASAVSNTNKISTFIANNPYKG